MSDIWSLLIGGGGGIGIWKAVEYFLIPKKDQKDFDQKFIEQLIGRVNNLEGRIDEQNKMLLEVMRENAELKLKNTLLQEEINDLKKQTT